LLLFGWLSFAVVAQRTLAWDESLMLAVGRWRSAPITWWMKIVSVTGSGAVEIPVSLLLLWWIVRRGPRLAAYSYASAMLSSWVLYGLAKLVVARPRPRVISHLSPDAGWYSYPSGHTMLAPLVFGLGAILWTRAWPRTEARVAAVLLAACLCVTIAFSRVYLGAHYPSDVIGGLLLGTALSLGWMLRLRDLLSAR
jgi:membrane-associated phospholipid phosphatase